MTIGTSRAAWRTESRQSANHISTDAVAGHLPDAIEAGMNRNTSIFRRKITTKIQECGIRKLLQKKDY
jgi:hypothetical protein